MGRDRKLPSVLAKVHPKFQTPYVSTLLVAVISLIVTTVFASQIDKLASLVNFGALTAFLFLHVSVINYFLHKQKSNDYINHFLFPLIGFIIIGYVWVNLDPLSKKLGLIWIAIGLVYLIFLRLTNKDSRLSGEL